MNTPSSRQENGSPLPGPGKREGLGVLCRLLGKAFLLDQKRQDEGRAYAGWGSRNGMEKPLRLGVTIVTSSCKEVLGDSHRGQTAP